MAASSRHRSPSPSPAPSSSYDIWTHAHELPPQIANSRKKPSIAQLQRLQTIFDASRYITKDERNILAHEIGLDAKFITVWFQNRRQSDKRKMWTKKDRAKKKENACQEIDTATLKPAVSLDQVASRMERVQTPVQPVKPRASPPSYALQLLNAPRQVKSEKSLEWACANARVGSKRRLKKDKRFREINPQTLAPCRRLVVQEKQLEVNSDDEDHDGETSTPPSSQSRHEAAFGTTAESQVQSKSDLDGKSSEDVEAAMVLLQFLQG
ncbi:hypothetical protein F5148DRAFT_1162250 [Russula earlei]|uniref:Uncharacterized protein n=1 Tax=Russula earlei TaxID=71964 RepID=A0ACC0ULA9_9AGAM|nr:hypothetical protein F5148DRAFT_1162250 [Russula earlei]